MKYETVLEIDLEKLIIILSNEIIDNNFDEKGPIASWVLLLRNLQLKKKMTEKEEDMLLNAERGIILAYKPNYNKNEKVRNLILKYRDRFSIGISIDGIKENHDTCRIYKDGRGSYDDAVAYLPWLLDNVDKRQLGVKATFTLDTFEKYYADSMIHIHKLGFDELAGNIVFEEIISKDKSHIIFKELKKVIDYILDNELENKVSIMQLGDLTRIRNYSPSPIEGTGEDPNRNWCGTCVHMACLGMDGKIYGCNRFCTMDKPGMELATFTNETVEIVNPELLNTVTSFKRSWKGECDTCFLKAECPTCVAAIFEAPDKDQYVAEKRQCGWTHGLVMARLYFKSKLKEREKDANAYVSQN